MPNLTMRRSCTSVRLAVATVILGGGLLAVTVAMRAQGTTLVRGPYLQVGTSTSIVVRWRTSTPTDSAVRYGPEPGRLTATAASAVVTTEHLVTLNGLTPHTRYFYAVGSSAGSVLPLNQDHSFVTAPVAGAHVATRLWVLGDSGTADANARLVRDAFDDRARDREADLWLMLGDNAYQSGTDAQYQAAVFDMYPRALARAALWPTFGNHDAISADSARQSGPYFDVFSLPTLGEAGGEPSGTEAYYSFDYGNVHLICLDSTESSLAPDGPMLRWLGRDVARTHAQWTIAFFHHAPYSKGSHDSDVESPLVEMRQNVVPLLEAAGVDLVLAGHSHSYERSYLLTGHYGASTTLAPSSILDAGSGRPAAGAYRKVRGTPATVYVTAGSSGQVSGGRLDHPAMARSLNVLGSLVVDVEGPRLRMTFLGPAGETQDLVELDSHDATGAPGPPANLRAYEAGANVSLAWDGAVGGGRPQDYVVEVGLTSGGRELGSASTGSLATALAAAAPQGRYVARLRAKNAAGQSAASNEVPILVAPGHVALPPPPASFRADVVGTTVRMAWDTVQNAPWGPTTYVVSAGAAAGRDNLGTLATGAAGLTVTGVPPGAYYLRVQSVTQGGRGLSSPDIQVVVGNVPAAPGPSGTPRAQVLGGTVRLTWAPPRSGTASDTYVIEAGSDDTSFTLGRLPTASAAPTLAIPGVPPGVYFVRVRGANALGEGLPSPVVRVAVP